MILLDMTHNNNKIFLSVVYFSLSQTNDEINHFLLNFEKILLDKN